MTEWTWQGARWWKFDFHTHTPASNDYGKGRDQARHRLTTPEEWLLGYMRAGMDCVAVTDHNSGAWVDDLKAALASLDALRPDGYRELYLFPGVEISATGGVHVLAIFDMDKSTSDIDRLLGAVGIRSSKGSCDVAARTIVAVVEEVNRNGGIAIPSHVDGPSGLFAVVTGSSLDQVLDCQQIFAMELVNPGAVKPQLYVNKKLSWTEVLGSDAHHPCGGPGERFPGSHFTWVKMETPSLEGLRLALLDGSLSVRRSDEAQSDNLNTHPNLALESVEVRDARYIGRSEPFRIGFSPWLNAIIGGRGTGKSTMVEFMRLALDRGSELPEAFKPDFKIYSLTNQARSDSFLLRQETSIAVTYRKDESRFRIEWHPDTNGNLQVERDGNWEVAEGEVKQRLPIRIFSQKQILHLAGDPQKLLEIVDEAIGEECRAKKRDAKEVGDRYLQLRATIRAKGALLSEESNLRGRLDDIKRKLEVFETAGHAAVLRAWQRRKRQMGSVDAWTESWSGQADQLRKVAADMLPGDFDSELFDGDAPEDAELLRHVEQTKQSFESIQQRLDEVARQVDRIHDDWETYRRESAWLMRAEEADQAYEGLKEKLAQEGVVDASIYGSLVQQRQTVEKQLNDIEARQRQIDDWQSQAKALLTQALETRRSLTELRRDFLSRALKDNAHVRIDVVPYGAESTVENEFRKLIGRDDVSFAKDIGRPREETTSLLGALYEKDKEKSLEAFEAALKGMKKLIRELAIGNGDQAQAADRRFAAHLSNIERTQPEALDRLDLWFPPDSLKVEYSAQGDGHGFKPIEMGSYGQKSAALLAFMLTHGSEPLILDQPEDDLDNSLIYSLVVAQLRTSKRHRQIIVVTHNANIVVNGDAEMVVGLDVTKGQTQIIAEGSLQLRVVREKVCEIMEGGRHAFEQRYRRIALEPDNVR